MENMLLSLLPVFLLVALGAVVRKIRLIGVETVEGLKTIIIRIALPAVLFTAFARAKMELHYVIIFALVFFLCVLLFLTGKLLHRVFPKLFPDEYTDAYFTGFEFGMIGVGLFPAIWGMQRLPEIALIAFGHEIFIWFFYVPVLEARKSSSKIDLRKTTADFFRSPTSIAIILGSALNITGIFSRVEAALAGKVLLNALAMLGNIIAPLILIVIGYSISFKKIPPVKSAALLVSRWLAVLAFGALVFAAARILVPSLGRFFMISFFAFLLLPPPFILPVFMKKTKTADVSFFSELLIYYTLLSFGGYVVLMSLFGADSAL